MYIQYHIKEYHYLLWKSNYLWKEDLIYDPQVLGQMYDYMKLIRNEYGVNQPFGILTTYEKSIICWLDDHSVPILRGEGLFPINLSLNIFLFLFLFFVLFDIHIYHTSFTIAILCIYAKANLSFPRGEKEDGKEELPTESVDDRHFFATPSIQWYAYSSFLNLYSHSNLDRRFTDVFVSLLFKLMRVEYSAPIIEHGLHTDGRTFLPVNEFSIFWIK